MKIYLDSCDVSEIIAYKDMGLVDGVTTNPSIIAKSGKNFKNVINDICAIIDTSVSVEVISTTYEEMLSEAEDLAKIADQIVIKLPVSKDGLKTCYTLSEKGISVNMTLCFSPAQALLAAKAGATYISPFIGRLDDMGRYGTDIIADICQIYQNYPDISTQILAASIRNPIHFIEVGKCGADVITIPPKLMDLLIKNPLTEKGIDLFLEDWRDYNDKKM
ncbi:MAG: transaldolase [Candidatus Midichloriaceae bacterium]|jgi:transaldolase